MHPWHDIPLPDARPLAEFPAVIEIPRGEKNKYEIDLETGLLKLDRVLAAAVHYPHNYGFIPRTLADDGDALDVLLVGEAPVAPLTLVTARAIGGFRMRDEGADDHKIVCVHRADPAFAHLREMDELPDHRVVEMMDFFDRYKVLEGKDAEVGERLGREAAVAVVERAASRYRDEIGIREGRPARPVGEAGRGGSRG